MTTLRNKSGQLTVAGFLSGLTERVAVVDRTDGSVHEVTIQRTGAGRYRVRYAISRGKTVLVSRTSTEDTLTAARAAFGRHTKEMPKP